MGYRDKPGNDSLGEVLTSYHRRCPDQVLTTFRRSAEPHSSTSVIAGLVPATYRDASANFAEEVQMNLSSFCSA
jgi:hypothetical protein